MYIILNILLVGFIKYFRVNWIFKIDLVLVYIIVIGVLLSLVRFVLILNVVKKE